jgi:pimeloyl-ACP methyl ester carboxylesterase
MPFFDHVSGYKVFYLEENPQGKPGVLLLHGLGANSASWQLQIPVLAQAGFHVLAIDTPGFGQSQPKKGAANPQQSAVLLSSLLQRNSSLPVHLVGISMGGAQALQLALDYPERIDRLVLVNTFAHLQIARPALLPYFVLRFILVHTLGLEVQARQVAKRIFPNPGQTHLRQELEREVQQADPGAYRAWMRALARFDVRKRLPEIQSPTLVITGSDDTTVAYPNQQELARCIPGAKHTLIQGAGHAVTIDKPDEFNQALLGFLCS